MSIIPIEHLMVPRHVAILGASDDPAKPGGRPIAYMQRAGYDGIIYPVNPHRQTVQGLPAYKSLADLPQVPDAVVVSVSAAQVEAAIEQCAAMGVRLVVLYTAGFAELDAEGAALQDRVVARAKAAGLRLVGPNTQGVANFHNGAILNFSGMLNEFDMKDGHVAIISQSGAGAGIVWNAVSRLGIGVRYLAATGNEADITASDVLNSVLQDDQVHVVAMYLESLRDPWTLAQAAALALERNVPILVVKAGRTESGQLTASSHTGALAGKEALMDAFLRQYGFIRCKDFDDLTQCLQVFNANRHCRGDRVVAISNSGAACVLSADAAEDEGLNLVSFDSQTQGKLAQVLPPFITARNPIDMSTALYTNPDILPALLDMVQASDCADMVLVGMPAGVVGVDFDWFAQRLVEFSATHQIPVAVSVSQDWVGEPFKAAGVPTFRSEAAAMRALAAFARYNAVRSNNQKPGVLQKLPENLSFDHSITLNEADSLQQLSNAGVPVVEHMLCRDVAQAQDAVKAFGEPLVLKGVANDVAHKTELGLVRLGVAAQDAEAVAQQLLETMAQQNLDSAGVIVARQLRGDFELALGIHVDPVFGHVVMVGQGGVLLEALNDVEFLFPPFTQDQAMQVLGRLAISRAFPAFRGMEAVDQTVLADLLVKLGQWALDNPGLISVDVNPVMVSRGAAGPVAVDAVVVTRKEQ